MKFLINFSSNSWSYQDQEELGGTSFSGLLATYSGGGSVQVNCLIIRLFKIARTDLIEEVEE
jgi:hypothetical protein